MTFWRNWVSSLVALNVVISTSFEQRSQWWNFHQNDNISVSDVLLNHIHLAFYFATDDLVPGAGNVVLRHRWWTFPWPWDTVKVIWGRGGSRRTRASRKMPFQLHWIISSACYAWIYIWGQKKTNIVNWSLPRPCWWRHPKSRETSLAVPNNVVWSMKCFRNHYQSTKRTQN